MTSATGSPESRRAARNSAPRSPSARRLAAASVVVALAVAAVAGIGGALAAPRQGSSQNAAEIVTPPPPAATAIPVPTRSEVPLAEVALCDRPEVQAGLAAGDDSAVIGAAGGGEGLRQAVIRGIAPCIDLRDPSHVWFVVNKAMPMEPIDYAPADWVAPSNVPLGNLAAVRTDIAPTVTAMFEASVAAGTGRIGMQNGYRGYSVQQRIHNDRVASLGKEAGERLAARPGYSEHQSGIAMDVFGCTPGCSSSEQFGTTATYQWVVEHSWEFGWIIRYEDGQTPITGYDPEAWHLRYIGPELAAAYHAGGFHTLEEFFGLPAAPGYLD
ncbi:MULTISPECIES: M15 family metallopeptidase [unclassified Microbacterium]|uniref:M15 family metallopeptidase n=1 Tax=unclassified Microbacterium TaxID=2609290 RepID=UPI000C2BD158|nr:MULTISPECIES: M15 family metallopeptidase [unclassified Microbacterium]